MFHPPLSFAVYDLAAFLPPTPNSYSYCNTKQKVGHEERVATNGIIPVILPIFVMKELWVPIIAY